MSIHYAEEQNFLTNYIFTKLKIVDNVWIGAKYIGNKQFQWEDKSILTGIGHYSNWAPGNPKNLTDHCVEMLSDENLRGKWTDERCEKRNIAICQRLPEISIRLLAETIVELKHSLQQTASKLVETESKLEKTLNQTANSLAETKKEVAQLKKESIPIGFIYVQLPKDKPPSELWPSMTWQDISASYENVFFRVVGSDAASFGQLQEYNAPRLETVYTGDHANEINSSQNGNSNLTIPKTGWSTGIHTGNYGTGTLLFIHFKHSDIAEVRPKNMAIKVFKRTA